MTLDPASCWRAYATRDRRFVGRFVMGVTSTGIYCRPGCPARLPAQRNVRFFASAAAAEGDGFRPCRRCRPETAPGTPAALGTSATVARALRLIDDGALDDGSVATLADRLGMTDRWLRALFAEQLGASPHAVAASRRAHLARRLLEHSSAPLEDVALAAGYRSARRMRAELTRVFQAAPSRLRGRVSRDAPLVLRLPARMPFEPAPILAFLAARALPGVEQVSADTYRRTVALPAGAAVVTLRADEAGVTLEAPAEAAAALPQWVTRATRVFDLDADAAAIAAHLAEDRALARALAGGTVRVPGAWDGFEVAVRALLGQQVSVAAARTLAARLVARAGTPLPRPSGGLTHLFPTPAQVAALPAQAFGVPRARAEALRALARAVESGALTLAPGADASAAREALLALPGVGPWTADYLLMRALGEPDALPAGDLALQRAMAVRGRRPNAREVLARAERWRPWRAYALIALWRDDSIRSAATVLATRSKRRTSA